MCFDKQNNIFVFVSLSPVYGIGLRIVNLFSLFLFCCVWMKSLIILVSLRDCLNYLSFGIKFTSDT